MNTAIADRFAAAPTLAAFIEGTPHAGLWKTLAARADGAPLPPALLRDAEGIREARNILVLLEEWCGDAINSIPAMDAFVSRIGHFNLRVLSRDANADLMQPHPSPKHPGSIPVAIAYDANFNELGRWGSRPGALQAWTDSETAAGLTKSERNAYARRWYMDDRGVSTVQELLNILTRVAGT